MTNTIGEESFEYAWRTIGWDNQNPHAYDAQRRFIHIFVLKLFSDKMAKKIASTLSMYPERGNLDCAQAVLEKILNESDLGEKQ